MRNWREVKNTTTDPISVHDLTTLRGITLVFPASDETHVEDVEGLGCSRRARRPLCSVREWLSKENKSMETKSIQWHLQLDQWYPLWRARGQNSNESRCDSSAIASSWASCFAKHAWKCIWCDEQLSRMRIDESMLVKLARMCTWDPYQLVCSMPHIIWKTRRIVDMQSGMLQQMRTAAILAEKKSSDCIRMWLHVRIVWFECSLSTPLNHLQYKYANETYFRNRKEVV